MAGAAAPSSTATVAPQMLHLISAHFSFLTVKLEGLKLVWLDGRAGQEPLQFFHVKLDSL